MILVSKGQFSTDVPSEFIATGAEILVNGTEVTSGVDESYTIIIPSKVDFGTLARGTGTKEKAFTVSAEGVVIDEGTSIEVKVSSDFIMTNGGSGRIPYYLYDETRIIEDNDVFAEFYSSLNDQSCTGKVFVDTTGILYAGDYSDIMTFTIEYVA